MSPFFGIANDSPYDGVIYRYCYFFRSDLLGNLLESPANVTTEYREVDVIEEEEPEGVSMTLLALALEGLKD